MCLQPLEEMKFFICYWKHVTVSTQTFQSLVWCWWRQRGHLEEKSKTSSCHRYQWPLKLLCSHVTLLLPKQVLIECEISGCCILQFMNGRVGGLCWADIWHCLGPAQADPQDKERHENVSRSLTWGTLGDLVINGEWKAWWQGNGAIRKKRERAF